MGILESIVSLKISNGQILLRDMGSLKKQSVGVVHQNQEFSIRNEEQLKIAIDMDMPVRSRSLRWRPK